MKDHGNLAATNTVHFFFGKGGKILTLEKKLAIADGPAMRQKAQYGFAQDGFAAARFTNNGKRLSLIEGKGDAAHGLNGALRCMKLDGYVVRL